MIGNSGKDWISMQIDMLAKGLATMLHIKTAGHDMVTEDKDTGSPQISEGTLLSYTLQRYLHEGKINDAEDLLFSSMEDNASDDKLKVAIDFYSELDKMSDSFLEAHDFSRQEIFEGLSNIKQIYFCEGEW